MKEWMVDLKQVNLVHAAVKTEWDGGVQFELLSIRSAFGTSQFLSPSPQAAPAGKLR